MIRKIKITMLCTLTLIIFLILASCRTSVLTITGEDTLEVGTSIKLDVNVSKTDEIVWESTDDTIASVFEGIVMAHKKGVVIISASLNGKYAEKIIEVTNPIIEITITGKNTLEVGDSFTYGYKLSQETEEKVTWKSSNEEILVINDLGVAEALKPGEVEITASIYDSVATFKVNVSKKKLDYEIIISGENKVNVGQEITLDIKTNPLDIEDELIYETSNEGIIKIDENGVVKGIKEGKAVVIVYSKTDSSIISLFEIEVINVIPTTIKLTGKTAIVAGEHSFIEVQISGNVSKEVEWVSSNEMVALCYQGIVLGLTEGTTTITAISKVDRNITAKIDIQVSKYVASKISDNDLARVNQIIDKMTLSQKVGQMFVVGFSGTNMSTGLENAIANYNLGNVIYLGNNVSNSSAITKLSNDIQKTMVKYNSVPAFITIDQEGGRVARITEGGTHFISQMAMAATNNYNNTYLEGKAMGEELKSYGINVNFAPVLDVNNNPDNPIIGIRSYSDNPVLAALYGNNMIKGLKASNVIACSKHFPGHGNTSVDSHYGLPIINSSRADLYKVELAPFISSINTGIDAIMTTHIIFSAIDDKYPATLSEKVLKGLLRNELGYTGLIITDGMGMDAIDKNFGSIETTSVLAVKAGVDILTYTSYSEPITAHKAIMKAIQNKEISEERINESVRRILLTKLKYGILDDYLSENVDRTNMLSENNLLNQRFALESLTLVKGNFSGLDSNKSTLIISPTSSYTLDSNISKNAFSNYAAEYLKTKGYKHCDYEVISQNITSTESNKILSKINSYEQIVIAVSNVKTSNYNNTASFVDKILKQHTNVVVIALDAPYDILSYKEEVNTYICVYGYQKATVVALAKYLNGEFLAKGVSPINEENYK